MTKQPQEVYSLGQFTFVPYHHNKKLYVGPGYGRHNMRLYNTLELEKAGAVKSMHLLWERINLDDA